MSRVCCWCSASLWGRQPHQRNSKTDLEIDARVGGLEKLYNYLRQRLWFCIKMSHLEWLSITKVGRKMRTCEKWQRITRKHRFDSLWICCCTCCTVRLLTVLLTNISTNSAAHDDNCDVLAACCATDVASAVAVFQFPVSVDDDLMMTTTTMMMMMDELTLTWHIVLRLQGHVTVKKESRNSRRVSWWY